MYLTDGKWISYLGRYAYTEENQNSQKSTRKKIGKVILI